MGEPLQQEKFSGIVRMPLRITLTLFTRWGEIGSLVSLWRILLGPRMFELVRRQWSYSNGKGFMILSEWADLSIAFPYQLSALRTFILNGWIGAVGSLIIFYLTTIPLRWIPVVVILSGFIGLLIRHRASAEVTVRGNLPDIIMGADALESWLAAGSGRKVRLEVWESIHLEIEAQTPAEIQSMFEAALTAQDQES
jgi:hypothetical protein